jgi:chromosome partitioning protein
MRCLLLDVDPQANTTSGLGFPRDEARLTTYDLLMGDAHIADLLLATEIEFLKLVPSSKDLIGATVELIQQENRAEKLRAALEPVRDSYDFILLDCPPALDLLTLNALVASDGLVVPMQAEYFALEGISELMHTLERVKENFNPTLEVEGILLTMYDDRTNLAQQVSNNLREHFGDKVFATTIPRNIRLAEAPSYGQPVALYDPRSRGAESYRELALELLQRNHLASRKDVPASVLQPRPVRFWPYS